MPHPLRPARPTRRRRARRHPHFRNGLAALLCLVTLGSVPPGDATAPLPPSLGLRTPAGASPALAALFDPRPMLAPEARADRHGAPLGASFALATPSAALATVPTSRVAAPAATLAAAAAVPARTPVVVRAEIVQQAQIVPLPVARPADLIPAPAPQRLALRRVPRRIPEAAPAPAAETPSFFEALFAARKDPGPAMAYAALENPALDRSRGRLIPAPDLSAGTAIYDISAHTVRLPGGEVLEAHSGLGASMDHPGYVHLRMRGSTPPGTYDLTEREALFHGVRAIRLSPVGGAAAIHGRDGLLAHTYMLGPSGASNGCVSFRNYDRFLQAYLRGEVRRLVVVAGRGDGPARFADGG